jgi:electron transport complex protein RnfD
MLNKTLHISTSPHLVSRLETDTIMFNVVLALLPAAIFATYVFGLGALLVMLTSVAACVLTEHLLCIKAGKKSTVGDWSAVITGLLLGMTLPPAFPLWMTFLGGVIAIYMGKYLFGGLGYNVFNPALVGRAFLQAAFPVAITTWQPAFIADRFSHISSSLLALPFMEPIVDGVTGATALSSFKFDNVSTDLYDLVFGFQSGSIGETCSIALLMGGIYLAARKMLNWRIPVAIFATVFVLTAIFYTIDNAQYPSPGFMLFSGGLMLGALFMATDMVASPLTTKGVIVYGFIIGLITVVIRFWGGLPEGVMYAILIANAFSPHIERLIRSRVYGTNKKNMAT